MSKKITLDELLKILDPQVRWLSRSVSIKGYAKEDLAQELRLKVTEDVRSGKGQRKGISWWFIRLKWHAIYLYRREMREPLSKSITLETILEQSENYSNKCRGGRMIKKADYKGFCKHIEGYEKLGIPWGLNDLRRLAKQYNVPIPKEYRLKGDK